MAGVYPDLRFIPRSRVLNPALTGSTLMSSTLAGNGSGEVDVDIAIIDTGVGPHADLNLVGGYDCGDKGFCATG